MLRLQQPLRPAEGRSVALGGGVTNYQHLLYKGMHLQLILDAYSFVTLPLPHIMQQS